VRETSRQSATAATRIRRRVVVRGRVHGVGFRAATLAEATRLAVAGWVRNCADGSVEAAFEGAPEAVAALIAFCERGPRHAHVSGVAAREEQPEGGQGFAIQ
jgi:acylphosphatase